MSSAMRKPFLVGLGGTTRPGSSSERVLQACLAKAADLGAETRAFYGNDLCFPVYDPHTRIENAAVTTFVEAVRRCDGLIVVSPGYHGSVSGLVKNALDYLEDLRADSRPYLHDRAVGCVGCAFGWQAAATTLTTLRTIIHALRGWPTPMGAAINTAPVPGEPVSGGISGEAEQQLALVAGQVVRFANLLIASEY